MIPNVTVHFILYALFLTIAYANSFSSSSSSSSDDPTFLNKLALDIKYGTRVDPDDSSSQLINGFSGELEDTKCTLEEIEKANSSQLNKVLLELQKQTFFRLFKIDLEAECKHIKEESFTCSSGEDDGNFNPFKGEPPKKKKSACSVEPEDESDLPPLPNYGEATDPADDTLSEVEKETTKKFGESCDDESQPEFWSDMCNVLTTDKSSYINLRANPEQNTGYDGSHIWRLIYEKNCFASEVEICYEEKVMYRLLSGMHASTSVSIFQEYYAPKKKGDPWRPNPEKFISHFNDHPDRLKNLHFAYVVVLRALFKAKDFLANYDYSSTEDGEQSRGLMNLLMYSELMSTCMDIFNSFDESKLFRESTNFERRRGFKAAFQDISSLINCVQCQRCRVHAKLHTLGIGTALKILLLPKELYESSISRQEVVALVNTAAAFSKSIINADELMKLYQKQVHDEKKKKTASVLGMDSLEIQNIDRLSTSNINQLSRIKTAIDGLITDHYKKNEIHVVDAIVVGSGLAGMSAALTVLERDGSVIIFEKEKRLGGNSNKASSGINAAMEESEIDAFEKDTAKSAGRDVDSRIKLFASQSKSAVDWLKTHDVLLDNVGQLGGHSAARTFRPSNNMIGAEVVLKMEKKLRSYSEDRLQILTDTAVTSLVLEVEAENQTVVGVKAGGKRIFGNVILASGGFGHSFSGTAKTSLLKKYRPDLLNFPTTLGPWTQGDGLKLATAAGADLVDMDKVQLHPTGFIDPKDPSAKTKTLAAELLRGVGGVLLNKDGKRFCDELGTRQYIVDRMLDQEQDRNDGYWMILSEQAALKADRHRKLYTAKGLLEEITREELAKRIPNALDSLAQYAGEIPERNNGTTKCPFGKKYFHNVPTKDTAKFYVGKVTPVIHYTMGGIKVTDKAAVVDTAGNVINGFFAAGEASGGLHGNNRLGGNSLLECVVFGRLAGRQIPIKFSEVDIHRKPEEAKAEEKLAKRTPIKVTAEMLAKHNKRGDVWVQIYDNVYDLTDYVEMHPGGEAAILDFAGQDATKNFEAVHNRGMLDDFEDLMVGPFAK